jgi:putative ABC transport system substrate-binding protein
VCYSFKHESEQAVNRREFITLLGGAAASWPLLVRAQQPKSTIGWMGESAPAGQRDWVAAFTQRMNELGWVEGRNIAIEFRWA